jgi:hypothetical protein
MAAAVTHVAYSAGFTPSGGSLWTIGDLVDIADSESGNMTELTTDNSLVVNGMFVDSNRGEITVTAKDMTGTTNAGAVIGTAGSLAIKYAKRSAGKGFVSSFYLTVTYANAVLRSISRQAGVTGEGTLVLVFGAYGTDGSTIKTAAVGA